MSGMIEFGRTDPEYRTYKPKRDTIRHYYGDLVRQILLGAAALMLIGAPFYTSDFVVQVPFIVLAAVVLVGLAALLNPVKRVIAVATAVASGAGAVMYQMWALWFYSSDDPIAFVLRQACAILLVFAFYFTMKTVRSMLMGLIGQETTGEDFAKELERQRSVPDTHSEMHELDALGRTPAEEIETGRD
jgi:hypothetical protein